MNQGGTKDKVTGIVIVLTVLSGAITCMLGIRGFNLPFVIALSIFLLMLPTMIYLMKTSEEQSYKSAENKPQKAHTEVIETQFFDKLLSVCFAVILPAVFFSPFMAHTRMDLVNACSFGIFYTLFAVCALGLSIPRKFPIFKKASYYILLLLQIIFSIASLPLSIPMFITARIAPPTPLRQFRKAEKSIKNISKSLKKMNLLIQTTNQTIQIVDNKSEELQKINMDTPAKSKDIKELDLLLDKIEKNYVKIVKELQIRKHHFKILFDGKRELIEFCKNNEENNGVLKVLEAITNYLERIIPVLDKQTEDLDTISNWISEVQNTGVFVGSKKININIEDLPPSVGNILKQVFDSDYKPDTLEKELKKHIENLPISKSKEFQKMMGNGFNEEFEKLDSKLGLIPFWLSCLGESDEYQNCINIENRIGKLYSEMEAQKFTYEEKKTVATHLASLLPGFYKGEGICFEMKHLSTLKVLALGISRKDTNNKKCFRLFLIGQTGLKLSPKKINKIQVSSPEPTQFEGYTLSAQMMCKATNLYIPEETNSDNVSWDTLI